MKTTVQQFVKEKILNSEQSSFIFVHRMRLNVYK